MRYEFWHSSALAAGPAGETSYLGRPCCRPLFCNGWFGEETLNVSDTCPIFASSNMFSRRSTCRRGFALVPDIRGRIAVREANLMGARRAVGLLAKIDVEALVEGHATLPGVAVDLQEVRAVPGDLGVELVVPGAVEGVGDVEAFAVEAELEHLRSAAEFLAAEFAGLAEEAAEPDLAGEPGVGGVAHVILADVAVQPVGEVEIPVVHRQDEIGDQPRHRDLPALDILDGLHLDDLLDLPLRADLVVMPHDAGESGAGEAVRAFGIVVEADFQ